jgi:dTDP-4-amino-4,6-dideoxygalactose transaminase
MITYIEAKQISFARVEKILETSQRVNHFSNNGPVKQLLENELESLLKIDKGKRVICLSNGTAALHALMFMFSKRGITKWVTPAFTFPSVTVGHGLDVDILDIDPETSTLPLDPELLEGYDGIVITTLFGCDVGIENWVEFGKEHNKVIIFDNASSPMTLVNNKNMCNFGDASFGSLHHTKYLGFGEGGFAVVDAVDYDELSAISNFGFLDTKIHQPLSSNFKMSDVSAAFILQHIEQYNLKTHKKRQTQLLDKLKNINGVQPLLYKKGTMYGNFPVVFDKRIDNAYFDRFGIRAQKYYKPLQNLPHSIDLFRRIINLPLYASLTTKNVGEIFKAIKANA